MENHPGAESLAIGFNDNFDFMGKELHIQTENVKTAAPCILTQVFYRGRVIHTTKFEYSSETTDGNDFSKIRELMHSQHLRVIKNISRQQEANSKRTR